MVVEPEKIHVTPQLVVAWTWMEASPVALAGCDGYGGGGPVTCSGVLGYTRTPPPGFLRHKQHRPG